MLAFNPHTEIDHTNLTADLTWHDTRFFEKSPPRIKVNCWLGIPTVVTITTSTPATLEIGNYLVLRNYVFKNFPLPLWSVVFDDVILRDCGGVTSLRYFTVNVLNFNPSTPLVYKLPQGPLLVFMNGMCAVQEADYIWNEPWLKTLEPITNPLALPSKMLLEECGTSVIRRHNLAAEEILNR